MVKSHSKAPMYITASEWATEWGGKKDRAASEERRLPFDCCAISFAPFEHPMAAPDGAVFDITNIVPFLKKFKCHPLTGEPLSAKELVRLTFHKNQDGAGRSGGGRGAEGAHRRRVMPAACPAGKYHCPVLHKAFNEFSHIVAIRPTGHVYSKDAVQQLCLKAGNLRDLLTEEPFKKEDVLVIQDPAAPEKRRIGSFAHVRRGLRTEPAATGPQADVRLGAAAQRVLEQVEGPKGRAGAASGSASNPGAGAAPPRDTSGAVPDSFTQMRGTTHHCAAGFTSTSFAPVTSNALAPVSAAEAEAARYRRIKALGKKAYVRLTTSLGALNFEIHADVVPKTSENFVGLCKKGSYDGTPFHRVIKNFMAQGGDPEGTGKGGSSLWGKPFKDEFASRLSHTGRGILSMANSGPNTNGSQFFVTFKSCTHLDGKHAIFGRLVGGAAVLDAIEGLPTDRDDRPTRECRILGAQVFADPFEEVDKEEREAGKAPAGTSAGPGAAGGAQGGGSRGREGADGGDAKRQRTAPAAAGRSQFGSLSGW